MSSITSFITGSTNYQSVPLFYPNEVVTYEDLNRIGSRSIFEKDTFLTQYFGSSEKGIIKGLNVNPDTAFDLQIIAGSGYFNIITSPISTTPRSTICKSDSALTMTIDDPDVTNPRIDLICCRASEQITETVTKAARDETGLYTDSFDTDAMKTIQFNYIKGTAAAVPDKPTVEDATLDLVLAYIYIPAGAADIDACNICDVRNMLFFQGGQPFIKFKGTREVDLTFSLSGTISNFNYTLAEFGDDEEYITSLAVYIPDGYDAVQVSHSNNTALAFRNSYVYYYGSTTEVDMPGLIKYIFYIVWVDESSGIFDTPAMPVSMTITINPLIYD